MRKNYLDNIRWITICLVVVFHIFFYYNNIGIAAMFAGLSKYQGGVTFGGLYQYIVYPWFMLLLFIIAGISARIALKKRSNKEFLKSRVDKLLVPSTLGVLVFGSIGGYVIYLHTAKASLPAGTPGFVGVIIACLSGIGALWFCHVLFVAVLILMLLRKLLQKRGDDNQICRWFERKTESRVGFLLTMIVLFLVFWGGSHILNMPLITSYRNGIYIPGFLAGFYIFSNDSVINKLKDSWLLTTLCAVLSGVLYTTQCYGLAYGDVNVLARFDVNIYVFFMILAVLGIGARFFDGTNSLTAYMKKRCFGIYVIHIPVLLVVNYFLVGTALPMAAIYMIELVSGFVISILLYEIISRIPILRYWILGMRKQ